jgi:hypothetical protein
MLFTKAQMRFVAECASKVKEVNGDELAVITAVGSGNATAGDGRLNSTLYAIVEFCAGECSRQQSGPLSVAWMLNAYEFAVRKYAENAGVIVEEDVLEMLAMIEPKKNASGYRKTPVRFANGNTIGAQNIEHQMSNLIRYQDSLEPLEFYIELERIHPAHDGNGRLGAILINWKSATLLSPSVPPRVDFSNLTVSQ